MSIVEQRSRAPDAAQHEVMRCRAGAHFSESIAAFQVAALRSNATRCSASGTREWAIAFDARIRIDSTHPRHEKAPVGGGRFL